MRYFINLSYDGAAYHGWQVQPYDVTVQQRLNEALATLLRIPVETVGAGRTDAGVNAACMVAHFDCDALPYPPEQLAYKLNRILPPDIAIHDIRPVKDDAHARFSALARTYHYYIYTEKSPFRRRYAMRLPFAVDYEKMNRAAEILLQTEDFTSFSKLHTDTKTNICHVTAARWEETEPGLWRFTITADRFLRNMVRAVVGTLLDVGRGKITEDDLRRIIDAHDRCSAGDSVMGEALFLADVRYPDDIYLA
ncbi:MAG: tRNA pseudouridine(38-40) synthase TruA [Bacteroidaceae bacterium]|nr:tRNA pseudouridine(38-40) synthase TruA [Bacteroidaceae bacterium]